MNKLLLSSFALLAVFLSGSKEVHALTGKKLFVFGNSYVDTGNSPNPDSDSWKEPYGSTYPGQPSGRWSNGRVWADYIAQHLKLPSPVPYEQRGTNKKTWTKGMNYAYGGTGVFDTAAPLPNMTVQIDNFAAMVSQKIYKASDLKLSVALISTASNDLDYYRTQSGGEITDEEWNDFIDTVVDQLITNVKRVAALGVKTIAVDGLFPLGCLPGASFVSEYTQCDETLNSRSTYLNTQLLTALQALVKTNRKNSFFFQNHFNSWTAVLAKYTPWAPCCIGSNETTTCGSVDENGEKLYSVCDDIKFFWDGGHPSELGWKEVYLNMKKAFKPVK